MKCPQIEQIWRRTSITTFPLFPFITYLSQSPLTNEKCPNSKLQMFLPQQQAPKHQLTSVLRKSLSSITKISNSRWLHYRGLLFPVLLASFFGNWIRSITIMYIICNTTTQVQYTDFTLKHIVPARASRSSTTFPILILFQGFLYCSRST